MEVSSSRATTKGSIWVTASVLAIHILVMALSFFTNPKMLEKKKSITVRTKKPRTTLTTQSPPRIAAVQTPALTPTKTPEIAPPKESTPPPAPAKETPKSATPPKKEIKQTPKKPVATKKTPSKPIKKSTSLPKETVKKQNNALPEQLLKDLQKNLENLNKWDQPKSSSTPTAKNDPILPSKIKIEDMVLTADEEDSVSGYGDILSNFLQESLHLPEYGEVTMSIRIKRDGTVLNVKVVHALSEKNKIYLEKTLPKLKFPSPASVNFMDKEKTFQVTFCNKQG